IAWVCALVGLGAVALLLRSSIALGERRGAFVSAVTHELRTPLTTFRMYAQMLHEGMVRDESQKRNYLKTLCVESDRLGHLIENVLAYARLERVRGQTRLQRTTVGEMTDRLQQRLTQRAEQAGMELVIDGSPDRDRTLQIDVGALDQILFNLVDNACKYAAEADDKRIHLEMNVEPDRVLFRVRDHGPGVGADVKNRLFRPFAKSAAVAAESAPGVGLGLALCRRMAAGMGGRVDLEPTGTGACFVLKVPLKDPDKG
ncbi:MAG: HAMP domain-containing sensor histidine kinase, partial [Phycisphaeraceae bacterium]|nr:HAMP domain-containing sensor histidine kinase [Phycisphaeraceae bacterium]